MPFSDAMVWRNDLYLYLMPIYRGVCVCVSVWVCGCVYVWVCVWVVWVWVCVGVVWGCGCGCGWVCPYTVHLVCHMDTRKTKHNFI